MGTISPGIAPCRGNSTVAVIVCAEQDVMLLLVSLVCGLGFLVGDSCSMTCPLSVLVVFAVAMVSSLGAGLRGGLLNGVGTLLCSLVDVFLRVSIRLDEAEASKVDTEELVFTFFTLPLRLIGSSVIIRVFGVYSDSISILSRNWTAVVLVVVAAMVAGRVTVADTIYPMVPLSNCHRLVSGSAR